MWSKRQRERRERREAERHRGEDPDGRTWTRRGEEKLEGTGQQQILPPANLERQLLTPLGSQGHLSTN